MKKYFQIIFIFLLVVTSFGFFGARFLNKSFVNYSTFTFVFAAILLSAPYLFIKRGAFVFAVQLISFSILLSILMAYLSWGQDVALSVVATNSLLLWVFFFYLMKIKIPVKTLETIVFVYAVIYLMLYFYQLKHSSTVLFGVPGWNGEFDMKRGIARIIFPGGGIFYLAVFMALNKITTNQPGKWFWSAIAIFGLIIPVMQVTRQYIAGILIIYLFHLIRNQDIFKKIIIIASFAGLLIYIGQTDNSIIKGLSKVQQETAKEGSKNIRVLAADYFITQFSPNIMSRVFGNGVPYSLPVSEYGKTVLKLNDKGYFLEDVGIVAFYAMFGIMGIAGYFIIWFKSFTLKLPPRYQYAKYYLWFLLISCLTSDSVYSPYFLISTVFALYIYQTIYEQMTALNTLGEIFKANPEIELA